MRLYCAEWIVGLLVLTCFGYFERYFASCCSSILHAGTSIEPILIDCGLFSALAKFCLVEMKVFAF